MNNHVYNSWYIFSNYFLKTLCKITFLPVTDENICTATAEPTLKVLNVNWIHRHMRMSMSIYINRCDYLERYLKNNLDFELRVESGSPWLLWLWDINERGCGQSCSVMWGKWKSVCNIRHGAERRCDRIVKTFDCLLPAFSWGTTAVCPCLP